MLRTIRRRPFPNRPRRPRCWRHRAAGNARDRPSVRRLGGPSRSMPVVRARSHSGHRSVTRRQPLVPVRGVRDDVLHTRHIAAPRSRRPRNITPAGRHHQVLAEHAARSIPEQPAPNPQQPSADSEHGRDQGGRIGELHHRRLPPHPDLRRWDETERHQCVPPDSNDGAARAAAMTRGRSCLWSVS